MFLIIYRPIIYSFLIFYCYLGIIEQQNDQDGYYDACNEQKINEHDIDFISKLIFEIVESKIKKLCVSFNQIELIQKIQSYLFDELIINECHNSFELIGKFNNSKSLQIHKDIIVSYNRIKVDFIKEPISNNISKYECQINILQKLEASLHHVGGSHLELVWFFKNHSDFLSGDVINSQAEFIIDGKILKIVIKGYIQHLSYTHEFQLESISNDDHSYILFSLNIENTENNVRKWIDKLYGSKGNLFLYDPILKFDFLQTSHASAIMFTFGDPLLQENFSNTNKLSLISTSSLGTILAFNIQLPHGLIFDTISFESSEWRKVLNGTVFDEISCSDNLYSVVLTNFNVFHSIYQNFPSFITIKPTKTCHSNTFNYSVLVYCSNKLEYQQIDKCSMI